MLQGLPVLDEAKLGLLIEDWLAARDAAAALLVTHLELECPRDILQTQYRGRHRIGDSDWAYRTHGIGVDVTRINGHGGVDFDFSSGAKNVFANPDWWRLKRFAKRAVHDRNVDVSRYGDIVDDLEEHAEQVKLVVASRIPDESQI